MSYSITNSTPPFPQLGTKITLKILSYLDRPDQLRFFCVNKGANDLKDKMTDTEFFSIWKECFGAELDVAPRFPTTGWNVVDLTNQDPAPPAPRIAEDVNNYFDQIGAGLLSKFF